MTQYSIFGIREMSVFMSTAKFLYVPTPDKIRLLEASIASPLAADSWRIPFPNYLLIHSALQLLGS